MCHVRRLTLRTGAPDGCGTESEIESALDALVSLLTRAVGVDEIWHGDASVTSLLAHALSAAGTARLLPRV
eukprot:35444-Eustigmatos_ZCMA.PRE.1